MPFSREKFLMTFFSHQPGFSDFPFLLLDFPYFCYVRCRIHDPFLTRKTHFSYSFHTFPRIRQHYFSKYWGTDAWAVPHLRFWGPFPLSPPRSPPLITASGINSHLKAS